MNTLTGEAIVVHGCQLSPESQLTERGTARMESAISLWYEDVAPNIAITGGHSFTAANPPARSEALVMQEYAYEAGVPLTQLHVEDQSLDTVGNVLFTKTELAIPNDWERLVVVTSQLHLPRTLAIYEHIMGSDLSVQGSPSPEAEHGGAKAKIWEIIGNAMVKEVLRGTKPGDHEAVQERLFDLVPGYDPSSPASARRLALKSLTGLLKEK